MLDWCFDKVIDFGHQRLTFDVDTSYRFVILDTNV